MLLGQWSFIHIFRIESFFRSHLQACDRVCFSFERTRASVVVRGRTRFCFFIPNFSFRSRIYGRPLAKDSWRRDSIARPSEIIRQKSWQIITSSHRGLTTKQFLLKIQLVSYDPKNWNSIYGTIIIGDYLLLKIWMVRTSCDHQIL